jgi:hypothetical protein
MLADRPRTVAQLAQDFGLSQPTMLEQVRRALQDELIVEIDVPAEQRRHAGERYYAPAVPVIRQMDRELLETACRPLAEQMAAALLEHRADLLAAFALTHLAQEGWEPDALWPYFQETIFRLTFAQVDQDMLPTPVPTHGLAWVEEIDTIATLKESDRDEGVA